MRLLWLLSLGLAVVDARHKRQTDAAKSPSVLNAPDFSSFSAGQQPLNDKVAYVGNDFTLDMFRKGLKRSRTMQIKFSKSWVSSWMEEVKLEDVSLFPQLFINPRISTA